MKKLIPSFLLVAAFTASRAADTSTDPAAARAIRAQLPRDYPAAFAPIADNPALPRVQLIGDSISIGYTPHVRALLAGVANVHRIPDNGGATTLGRAMLDEWLGAGKWDVIHFNFGLHDVARVRDLDVRTPSDVYVENLRRIVERLRRTGAKLVFATTTPVPGRTITPPRSAADVVAINGPARALMAELGVAVNDLYAFVEPRLGGLQLPANVHFTDAGSRALAEPVAAAIRQALAR